nr:MAG TPA: hypothetical protein [Caudoviricetes sp.]
MILPYMNQYRDNLVLNEQPLFLDRLNLQIEYILYPLCFFYNHKMLEL